MKIQLWSYNYSPEPTGIAPVSATFARAMRDRGHDVHVIAAHPHYPEPRWGTRLRPYRETIDGITVTRLPLWIGRGSTFQRICQEFSFAAAMTLALPTLGRPDLVIAVSPSFPALGAAIINKRLRKVPWLLWLQDILPDGAQSTGIIKAGRALRLARRLERAAYASADRVIVISNHFKQNLLDKGVDARKLAVVFNPATLDIAEAPHRPPGDRPPRVLVIGNIGHSQGLVEFVTAFQASSALERIGASLAITGSGVAADDVRAAIVGDRVQLLGLVEREQLYAELDNATVALVSQRSDFPEFNLPSKLMNYLARGVPVFASVGAASEVAAIVESAGAGLVASNADLGGAGDALARMLEDTDALVQMSERGRRYAAHSLTPEALAAEVEKIAQGVLHG